ncbi:MAG TPA: response regulator [Puia sp.]|nr:response regulator [Puia sp.]
MRILIADANHQDRQVLREIIYQLDRRIIIETALSARQLFRKLNEWRRTSPPALLFLEFGLPGANVLAVLERIRYFNFSPAPAVFVLSDVSSPDNAELCCKWGAKNFLLKSLPPSTLKYHIGHILLSACQNAQG